MLFTNVFNSLSKYLENKSPYINITVRIPKDIMIRTKLICDYISHEEDCNFDLNIYIYLLYLDFIKDCIENYNPKKILDRLAHDYINQKSLIITNGYEKYQINTNTISFYKYSLRFDKDDAAKGILILDELFELFHFNISFDKLIEQLWISFIYNYKTGDNKKAFSYLRRILRENLV